MISEENIKLQNHFFDSNEEALFSVAFIAKILNKSPNTLKSWMKKGLISFQTFGDGSKPKLRKKHVIEFLNENEVKATPQMIVKNVNVFKAEKNYIKLQNHTDSNDIVNSIMYDSLSPEIRKILMRININKSL